MINTVNIIKKYYDENSSLYKILVDHGASVTEKALEIARKNPQENFDTTFVAEAAMLHDIGIYLTNAPGISCFGDKPYICHGYLGSDILRQEGLPKHALVAERHTGVGLSQEQILRENLPLPHRNMLPVSNEEKLICLADKFFSKTRLGVELSFDEVIKSLAKFGEEPMATFKNWYEKWVL
jgi:uncharacterized protein